MKTLRKWKHYKYIGRSWFTGQWYCTRCGKPCWTFYSGLWATDFGTPICECEKDEE